MYKCGQKQTIYEQYYPHFLSQIAQTNFGLAKAQVAPIYSPPSFFKRGQNIAVYNSQPPPLSGHSYFDDREEVKQPQVPSLLFIKFK